MHSAHTLYHTLRNMTSYVWISSACRHRMHTTWHTCAIVHTRILYPDRKLKALQERGNQWPSFAPPPKPAFLQRCSPSHGGGRSLLVVQTSPASTGISFSLLLSLSGIERALMPTYVEWALSGGHRIVRAISRVPAATAAPPASGASLAACTIIAFPRPRTATAASLKETPQKEPP